MAQRKDEQVLVTEDDRTKAGAFLETLWQGVALALQVETNKMKASELYPDSLREAEVAAAMISSWEALSQRIIQDPGSLTLRSCGIERTKKLVVTQLPDGSGGKVFFETRYSTVGTIVDGKPDHHRFAQSPERGTPQVEVGLRELYQNSRREILEAITGVRESQSDVGLTAPAESGIGKVDGLETEAFFSGRIVARELTLMGKATWFDPRNQAIRTWDLAGGTVTEALASGVCPVTVNKRMKFGRLDDHTDIHPIAFNHELLETVVPALFAAVEPFARRVARIAQKGK